MIKQRLSLTLLLCLFAVSVHGEDKLSLVAKTPRPPKPDAAVVRKYLAMRAEYAADIEKQWRDDFEKTGRLPGEDESENAADTPPLDAPAKEHLGKSNPDTLIPQLQKELTRLVKLSSNRELDRAEKREAKKQATRVRISLSYIKRHKEEFRKAIGDPKQKLEKLIADMHKSPLTEYFKIGYIARDQTPRFELGQFGMLFVNENNKSDLYVLKVIDRSTALVSIFNPEGTKSTGPFHLEGISTDGYKSKGSYLISGFFYVSGKMIYATVTGEHNVFVVDRFDPIAAMKSVKP